MKFTSKILLGILILVIGELLCSNIILKKEYDKIDKTDIYWTYENVLSQPFKYLKITGGNGTRIAFEQSPKYSVRILQEWKRYHGGEIKAHVTNDTLYIDFDFVPANIYDKFWMKGITAVRIFSPELLSVDGFNTNFEMNKMKQKSINVNITGRSKFELESLVPSLDSLIIAQKDSSEVVFEMAPEYHTTIMTDPKRVGISVTTTEQVNSNEGMSVNSLIATVTGNSLLDIGHAQIQSLQVHIADSSGIILSGGALKKIRQ